MKKVLLSLVCLVLLVTSAFAILIDYQNTTTDKPQRVGDDTPLPVINQPHSGVVKTADGAVKASAGTVYTVVASFVGSTKGDTVELENSLYTATGTSLITLTSYATDCFVSFPCTDGISFDSGIWYDESLSGGDVTVTIEYE